MVEARGVEPLSENPSAALSTSVDGNLKFPPTLMTPATAVVGNGGRTVAVN